MHILVNALVNALVKTLVITLVIALENALVSALADALASALVSGLVGALVGALVNALVMFIPPTPPPNLLSGFSLPYRSGDCQGSQPLLSAWGPARGQVGAGLPGLPLPARGRGQVTECVPDLVRG